MGNGVRNVTASTLLAMTTNSLNVPNLCRIRQSRLIAVWCPIFIWQLNNKRC